MFYKVTLEFESEPNDKGKTTKTKEDYFVEDETTSGAEYAILQELGEAVTGSQRVTGVVELPKFKGVFLKEETLKELLGLKKF
jgi:hypothetical protein